MKKLIKLLPALIVATLLTGTANAGPFVAFQSQLASGGVGAPQAPSHPVSQLSPGFSDDQETGTYVALGYRGSRWSMEIGKAKFGAFARIANASGSDATFIYHSTSRNDESGDSTVLKVGREFAIAPGVIEFYVQGGAHHFTMASSERMESWKSDNSTVMTSAISKSTERSDTSGVASIGFDFLLGKGVRLNLGATSYGAIDRTTVDVGLSVGLSTH